MIDASKKLQFTQTYIYIYVCIHIYIYTYVYIHMYVYDCICVYIYMQVHIYTSFVYTEIPEILKPSYIRGTTGSAGNTALAVSLAESWLAEIQLGKTMPNLYG